jgi:glycosyltransferase involved in cell wall biosynthesis
MIAEVYTGAPPPLRIGFLLTELAGGGAERSMLSIIGLLDRARFAPQLILFEPRIEHEQPEGIPLHVLSRRGLAGPGRMISRVFELAALARRERLQLLVSFLTGPNLVATLAARRAGIPALISERSAPSLVFSRTNRQLRAPWLWSWLVRRTYPLATALLTNTAGAKAELERWLDVPSDRVSVLPNALDLDRIRRLAAEPIDDLPRDGAPLLVNVARFTYAKDHATLLQAFARVRSLRPSTLVLVGGGEDEARIRALCTRLDLDGDVVFTGFTRNPYRVLARATVSVLSSRFEGLPNAVIESMALGIPVVSTACPYGPIELLGSGENRGVLVPVGDAAALAGAIVALLDDEPRRRALAAGGLRYAREFDQHQVAMRYEALFEATAARYGSHANIPAAAPAGRAGSR